MARPFGTRWGLARALRIVAAAALLVLVAPPLVYVRGTLEPGNALEHDLGQEYLLARAIADGIDPYLPIKDLAARYLAPEGVLDKLAPTPHPPTAGLLFLPFLLVDFATAVRLWFVVQVFSLVVGVGLALRAAQLPIGLRWAPLIACALVAWVPVATDLALGQLTTPLLALLAGSQLALLTGRGALAGGLLGLSLLLKPLAWPWLILMVGARAWVALAATLAVVVVGYALVALRVGVGPVIAYVTQVLPSTSADYATNGLNISLWTIGPRLFRGTDGLPAGHIPPLLESPEAAPMVGLALPLLLLVLAVAWLVRTRPPIGAALGILTCVAIVVNPVTWPYNLVLAILPAAQVLGWLHAHRYPRSSTVLAAALAVGVYVFGSDWHELLQAWSGTAAGPDNALTGLANWLTVGPTLATVGLGLFLAWLTRVRASNTSEAAAAVVEPSV